MCEASNLNFLAISGSLRSLSQNSALLRAAARLAPKGVSIEVFQGLDDLPLFNPDKENSNSVAVQKLESKIIAADALIIASPEYAHGITGVLKNALDWMVSSTAFVNKPVILFNASPRSTHAYASLYEVISVMSAHLVSDACIALPIRGSGLDEQGIYAHPELSRDIQKALSVLFQAVTCIQHSRKN